MSVHGKVQSATVPRDVGQCQCKAVPAHDPWMEYCKTWQLGNARQCQCQGKAMPARDPWMEYCKPDLMHCRLEHGASL